VKDTRAYSFIGNRDAGTHCDECQQELVGYERFVCCHCDPDAQEWEWEDHDGEVWEDPGRAVVLVVGTYDNNPRMLSCLVLDQLNFDPNPLIRLMGFSLLEGEVIQYPRGMFVQGREEDGTTLQRII
jgi:hypothetical protein